MLILFLIFRRDTWDHPAEIQYVSSGQDNGCSKQGLLEKSIALCELFNTRSHPTYDSCTGADTTINRNDKGHQIQ